MRAPFCILEKLCPKEGGLVLSVDACFTPMWLDSLFSIFSRQWLRQDGPLTHQSTVSVYENVLFDLPPLPWPVNGGPCRPNIAGALAG